MGNIDIDIDDQHRNTNMNNKDHLVGQLTRANRHSKVLSVDLCTTQCVGGNIWQHI